MKHQTGYDVITAMVERIWNVRKAMPEPDPDAPPALGWVGREMEVMYRFIAGEAGLPGRCPDTRCARAGHCRGRMATCDENACAQLWDDSRLDQLVMTSATLMLALLSNVEHVERRETAERRVLEEAGVEAEHH